jgi:phosphoglycerate dehydrogenase-like enzyme
MRYSAGTNTPMVLFTTERSRIRDVYFPHQVLESLERWGEVRYHEGPRPLSTDQLAELLHGVDVCITHWGCPRFTPEVLAGADRLRLIAHAAGSVADLVSSAVFERGIVVTSANSAMAPHVAEGVLAYLLADLHRIPERAQLMREGGWLDAPDRPTTAVSEITIGLVGLGLVGRHLLHLLQPFNVQVLVHDPFVAAREIEELGAESVELHHLLTKADVVSLHASLTDTTRGILDADMLAMIRDGGVLINTARAALIDTVALTDVLRSGRIRAVLDVFDVEPLPSDDPLRSLRNVTLMPHAAGSSSGSDLAAMAVEEVARFARGESPAHPITYERYQSMTRES